MAQGPLAIIALGPLTNIARAISGHHDLQSTIVSIIAVMGRRPGHVFHPAEGGGEGILFGHGPVFRDFNFAMDPIAANVILATDTPVTLVPYDAAKRLEITAAELDRLTAVGGSSKWVADRSRGWLRYWQNDIGRTGFYPFDLLAAGYVIDSRDFECAAVRAWIGKDDSLWHLPFLNSPALLIDQDLTQLERAQRRPRVCIVQA